MQYMNPCRDRELDLRGKIITICVKCVVCRTYRCFCLRLCVWFTFRLVIYTTNENPTITNVNIVLKSFNNALVCLLAGYKIPQIENMGATLDQFDTIDFSDNDLRRLEGFPFLPRMKCLLLNNNRIV